MTSNNYVFAIDSTAPSPTGRGTMLDWLTFYKFEADGDVFVATPSAELGGEGGCLWFQVDDHIVAHVPIKSVMLDPFSDLLEFWFDPRHLVRIKNLQAEKRGSRWIALSIAEAWRAAADKTLSGGPPKSTG